jgi:hypothetical protein
VITYRYGINFKPDTDDDYYRFKSSWTCYSDLYPQPVWLVVREIEIKKKIVSPSYRKKNYLICRIQNVLEVKEYLSR